MSTYILVTKLSSESLGNLDGIEENGTKWKRTIEEKCPEVRFICHYSILGPYDFLSIFEAPNEQVASKVSLISMSFGAQKAESWIAIPYHDFIKQIRDLTE